MRNAVKGVADAIEAVEVLGFLVRAATFPFRLLARALSQFD